MHYMHCMSVGLGRKEESWGVWWYRVAVHSIGMYVFLITIDNTHRISQ